MGEYNMSKIERKSRKNRQQVRLQRHKRSICGISAVILLLVVVVSVNSITLRAKNKSFLEQEAELKTQIEEQESRAKEIEELESYVGTDEYIEQIARNKLGLVHENEIIFKAK